MTTNHAASHASTEKHKRHLKRHRENVKQLGDPTGHVRHVPVLQPIPEISPSPKRIPTVTVEEIEDESISQTHFLSDNDSAANQPSQVIDNPFANNASAATDNDPQPIADLWREYFSDRTFEIGGQECDYFEEYKRSLENRQNPPFILRGSEELGIDADENDLGDHESEDGDEVSDTDGHITEAKGLSLLSIHEIATYSVTGRATQIKSKLGSPTYPWPSMEV
jgi:hypothetical protein